MTTMNSNPSSANAMNADKSEEKKPARGGLVDEKLFNSRAITIFGEINDKIARSVTERLLALAAENDEPISIYVSSPGGHVESGDVIYDIIKFIKPTVRVIGTGWVASAATTIYLAAAKENRFALPKHAIPRAPAFRGLARLCHGYRHPSAGDR